MTKGDIRQKALNSILRYGSDPPMIDVLGTKADSMLLLDDLPDDHHQSWVFLFAKGAALAKTQQIGTLRELFLASEA